MNSEEWLILLTAVTMTMGAVLFSVCWGIEKGYIDGRKVGHAEGKILKIKMIFEKNGLSFSKLHETCELFPFFPKYSAFAEAFIPYLSVVFT